MPQGFGLIEEEDLLTLPSDEKAAAILKAAVGTLPARITGASQSRPSAWPNHFRLLRVRDDVSADDILRVVEWYARNIGKEFVPLAFSGEAFRKKFHAIERQADKDITCIEVGPLAGQVAAYLQTMAWPKGSAEALPGAVQACLTAYEAWLQRLANFRKQLAIDDLSIDYGTRRKSLHRLATRLWQTSATPTHFVQLWMEGVLQRIKGWGEWSGDFTPYIFKPESERFRNQCREEAGRYTGNPDAYDHFLEVMNEETI